MAGYASLTHPTDHTLLFEHLFKQRLRPLQSFFRENHRFHLADGIADHALVVQTPKHVSIKSFPGVVTIVQCQIKQR
jgi:hypothetical protein